MRYDNKERKNWYVFNNMEMFTDSPKDDAERRYFDSLISEARRTGRKVRYVFFNKTEKEVHDWFNKL